MGEEGRVREKGNCDAGVNESQSYTEMLNSSPSAPESSTLTTRLLSHSNIRLHVHMYIT